MLIQLSFRNAKRQFREYMVFFLTLTCSIALMYGFQALVFSESIKMLPDLEILPYMILTASLLLVFIMSWIINYMIHAMLKKRSKEFSIYMVSGISNQMICMILFYENSFIGALAFLPGILVGLLFSQVLEAILLPTFGLPYLLHFPLSLPALGLTFLYFSLLLFGSIWKNRKWVQKVQLHDLLYYNRENEKTLLSNPRLIVGIFFLSALLGCAGFPLIYIQPLGNGYDVLIGTIFLVLFLFGFFLSVPTFLVAQFENRIEWKYRKNRLVPFRGFTAKINSTSMAMGILSILFMLAITSGGIGTAIGLIVTKTVEANPFDLMILHVGELYDFSNYERQIGHEFPITGYAYPIYTDKKTDFLTIRNHTIIDMGHSKGFSYAEFQSDTYITQSDYKKLRELLGYPFFDLDPSSCYIHCVPALKKNINTFLEYNNTFTYAGYSFATDGIFTEPFSQGCYGNGLDYIIVVPDAAIQQMQLLYSLYAAKSETPFNNLQLQSLTTTCDRLVLLSRNHAKSTPSGAPTALIYQDNMDYLSGKWVDKDAFQYLYAMPVCLFYFALILEITGAAILATQVLSDWKKKQQKEHILRQLGMSERWIVKLNRKQLLQIFLFPLFPSLLLSSCFVSLGIKKIVKSFFHLPMLSDSVWIGQSLGITLIFFLFLYSIYYIAAQIGYHPYKK